MDKILYFPYINLPKTSWTVRTLLYYDNIGSIVPTDYFYNPERNYEPFMLELVRSGLVIPIDPIETLEFPWGMSTPLVEFFQSPYFRLNYKIQCFLNGRVSRIHAQKFDGQIFYSLEQIGLARRLDNDWYFVETSAAEYLMKYLATIISTKLEMLPTTDTFRRSFMSRNLANQNKKRETILSRLIPFPEEINLPKLLKFKEKHNDLLKSFKNKVEQIVLDENIIEGTELFKTKIEELEIDKNELSIKMNESQFNNVFFGSVCGIIGAAQGFASTENTTGAVIGALPGFASAIHSALKIERAENLFDQSGMKYLALVDRQLRDYNRNN
ncbi:kinase [Flavobacterium koreense]